MAAPATRALGLPSVPAARTTGTHSNERQRAAPDGSLFTRYGSTKTLRSSRQSLARLETHCPARLCGCAELGVSEVKETHADDPAAAQQTRSMQGQSVATTVYGNRAPEGESGTSPQQMV
jgi:hypothetical protein